MLTAPAAHAEAVRVRADESVRVLVAAPGGGVWASTAFGLTLHSAVLRVRSDGRVTRTPVSGALGAGAVGADGAAYFFSSPRPLVRVDDAGTATPVRLSPAKPGVSGEEIATGPDGRVWATTSDRRRLAQIAPDGSTTYTASGRRHCSRSDPDRFSMARASDTAMWLADDCPRLVRDGRAIPLIDSAESLTADAAGGVWFLLQSDDALGHATAAGEVSYQVLEDRPDALAAAPDGSAWLADGRCELTRVAPTGAVSTHRASVAADRLVFAPDGLWLGNDKLVARADDPRPCDDEAPRPTIRRAGATITVTVREPAVLDVTALTQRHYSATREYRLARARTIRYRLTRALAKTKRVFVVVRIADPEGNSSTVTARL